MIMFRRRSIRSATAPASGPSTSAGNREDSQTPPTAAPCAASPFPARVSASVDSATRLSQSPRLDSDVAIHSRRNGLMDSTPPRPVEGDRKFTAPGYPHGAAACGPPARECPDLPEHSRSRHATSWPPRSGRPGQPGPTWLPTWLPTLSFPTLWLPTLWLPTLWPLALWPLAPGGGGRPGRRPGAQRAV